MTQRPAWNAIAAETAARAMVARADRNGWCRIADPIDLAISAEAGLDGDRTAYLAALEKAGYSARASVDHDLRVEFILAEVGPAIFEADGLWKHEQAVAAIALAHGYIPVGCETSERGT